MCMTRGIRTSGRHTAPSECATAFKGCATPTHTHNRSTAAVSTYVCVCVCVHQLTI